MTIVAIIAGALIAAIAVLLIVASRQADRFDYKRSALIAASPESLFAQINDLRALNRWNPYALRETSGAASYSGPDSGVGQRFTFAGRKSGTGYTEIIAAQAPSRVDIRLVMTKPFSGDHRIVFSLQPEGPQTRVTWGMTGAQPFIGKIMATLIDCEKMMAKDFDAGLANLKAIAETR